MKADLPRSWLAASIAGGVIAGIIYTLSPLTVIVSVAVPLLWWAGARGLSREERHQLYLLLSVAFALRVLAIGALFLTAEHNNQASAILFGDEAYTFFRTLRIRNILLGIPSLKYDYTIAYDAYGRTSYLQVFTAVQMLFGPAPYGMRLVNALVFFSGALVLFRLARRSFGALPAFGGLAVLLFLPSLFFWSISLLKESLHFAVTATVLAATVWSVRSPSWYGRLLCAVAVAAGLWVLRDLRTGAVILTGAGLALGLAAWFATKNARRFSAAVALVALALAALTVKFDLGARALTSLEAAAQQHSGHVFTVGHAYKLLDEGFYMSGPYPQLKLTPGEATRFVIRGLASFFVVPLPWHVGTTGELVQIPEQLLWYAMVILAPIGAVSAMRKERLLVYLLIGYVLPTIVAVALTNGNVGTLIRFRGLVTPYIVWPAALGFCVIIQRLSSVRTIAQNPLPEPRGHLT